MLIGISEILRGQIVHSNEPTQKHQQMRLVFFFFFLKGSFRKVCCFGKNLQIRTFTQFTKNSPLMKYLTKRVLFPVNRELVVLKSLIIILIMR
ncbi:hypothetical protein DS745_21240 [Anaerobacillus alkaliphilus]|uniref:Uncharacterized protein n=1 Tax=Anaerobacillus alkaliphilus TaxID=1548597 RepID=A0A4Q0VM48_9BACI|nr:hypothetical protein DS745_21240 [Anaerobacillus alkaliphilus]